MKIISIITLIFLVLFSSTTIAFSSDDNFDHNYKVYSEILNENVKNGLVNYKNIKNNRKKLNDFLKSNSKVNKEKYEIWNKEKKLSFLINLYNAETLNLVAKHYPLESIKNLDKPWDKKIIDLFGKKISLNQLENEIIRKEFNEPRIHFALVCAALGCPKLLNEPYKPDKLEYQLKTSTYAFLKEKDKNYIDKDERVIFLSPIFEWFKIDFERKSGSVNEFISLYFESDTNSLKTYKIKYTNYDWSLNDQKN